MKTRIILGLILLMAAGIAVAGPIEEGKALFTTRCAACHNVNKVLTGPALAGVDQRRSIDWIINFVHSSSKMVAKGDKDAVAIYQKFNKIPMPDHPDLSAENIKQIVEYIKTESKPVDEFKAPFAKPRDKKSNAVPLSAKNYGAWTGYGLMVAGLIGSLLFAVQVKGLQRKKVINS